MFKNISLRTMSVLGSLAITAFVILCLWAMEKLFSINLDWSKLGLFFIALALFSFFAIYFILDRFIYRRIKLIYKIIRRSKSSVPDRKALPKSDDPLLDGVEKEVQQWAEIQQKEIETLKTLETYRKRFIGNVSHELKTP
ncbi:MAG TPA: sensor histidine kinase, partial [Saprospiraceae bacterium]|nr:sensor histidine kinase [Saprospiraceae bacterium]